MEGVSEGEAVEGGRAGVDEGKNGSPRHHQRLAKRREMMADSKDKEEAHEPHSSTNLREERRPHELLTTSYQTLLGSNFHTAEGCIQVTYRMEVPTGKAETFMAAFWKHERSLQAYCTRVRVYKSLDGIRSEPPRMNSDEIVQEGALCHACVLEGRSDPCPLFVPGPLRRVKEQDREERKRSLSDAHEDVPAALLSGATVSSSPPSSMMPVESLSTSGGSAPAHEEHIPSSPQHGSPGVIGPSTMSPAKKKIVSRQQSAWRKRIIKFVERRCRSCNHLPHEHASEGSSVAYTM